MVACGGPAPPPPVERGTTVDTGTTVVESGYAVLAVTDGWVRLGDETLQPFSDADGLETAPWLELTLFEAAYLITGDAALTCTWQIGLEDAGPLDWELSPDAWLGRTHVATRIGGTCVDDPIDSLGVGVGARLALLAPQLIFRPLLETMDEALEVAYTAAGRDWGAMRDAACTIEVAWASREEGTLAVVYGLQYALDADQQLLQDAGAPVLEAIGADSPDGALRLLGAISMPLDLLPVAE
jgi:hypothetical protein